MDYPKNYRELIAKYNTNEACVDFLASVRWPEGFVCSRCGASDGWKSSRYLWVCHQCEYHASVLAGTIFQDTKLPLPLWFQMIWWFVGQKSGASALSLQGNFGIGSYRTAWQLLEKLRSCMVVTGRSLLSGKVEVDEAFLGGENNKEIVMVAAEIRGKATGRIRMRHIHSRTSEEIQKFIMETIEPGATIISDQFKSYVKIVEKGYAHEPQKKPYFWENASGDDERLMPRVHRAISLVKRWYYGTYHGRIEAKNLQNYLDEFVFRFNRRTSGSRGLLFFRMVDTALKSPNRPKIKQT